MKPLVSLKDKWVTLRSIQRCTHGHELAHGESARYRVYLAWGEFHAEYVCFRHNAGERVVLL